MRHIDTYWTGLARRTDGLKVDSLTEAGTTDDFISYTPANNIWPDYLTEIEETDSSTVDTIGETEQGDSL